MSRVNRARPDEPAPTPSTLLSTPSSNPADASLVIAMWLVTAHLLLMIAGVAFLRSDGVMVGGNQMSVPRAIFTSVNAGTMTGFTQSIALDQIQPRGKAGIAALMICGTFLTLTASTLAVARILRKTWSITRIFLSAGAVQVIAGFAGAAMLSSHDRTFDESLFQAASAFSNCGLTIGATTDASDPRTFLVMLPLAVIGGLGLAVILDLLDAVRSKQRIMQAISTHSRVTLGMTAALFLIGLLACAWLAVPPEPTSESFRVAARTGIIASLNSRSAGLPIEAVHDYPRTVHWTIIILMAIGAGSAGTAGGLKVSTIFELFRGSERSLRGEKPGRGFGIAMNWLGIYSLLVFLSLLSLMQNEPQLSADRALFNVVSAASNVGLSHDPLSVTSSNAYTLAATMLLGRFLPILVLWWTAMTSRDVDVVIA